MARVMLHPDVGMEVIEPPTEEEVERGKEALLGLARALGRMMAEEDFADEMKARRSRSEQTHGSSGALSVAEGTNPVACPHSNDVSDVASSDASSIDQSSRVTPRG